jgi:hypothetical protein
VGGCVAWLPHPRDPRRDDHELVAVIAAAIIEASEWFRVVAPSDELLAAQGARVFSVMPRWFGFEQRFLTHASIRSG